MGHHVVYLIRLIADAGYDRATLGGLDRARVVEDLTWLLFAAMKDGAPVFYRFATPLRAMNDTEQNRPAARTRQPRRIMRMADPGPGCRATKEVRKP